MGGFAKCMVHLRGMQAAVPLKRAIKHPARAQATLLQRLLRRNADTVFGREHRFARLATPCEYAQAVPIRDYEGFRTYVERVMHGESGILTGDAPFMFTTTSGTTADPKLLPVTKDWQDQIASLMRLWLYWASRDHADLFSGRGMSIMSPAVESYTPAGQPIGAVSGLAYRRLPRVIRRTYAIPYEVMTMANYEDRYFASMRLALARDVSVIATPNPSTLIRLAEIAERRTEEIVRAVHDGRLGLGTEHLVGEQAEEQRALYRTLEAQLSPRPKRAKELAQIVARHAYLLPRYAWPGLKMIGCWLGGSCGVHAGRLADLYGCDVPLRDLGLRASEATVTIPFEDNTPAGILALHTNFYEFIPEQEIEDDSPVTLLAHELERDCTYYLILTTSAGLYRYDINDIVQVVDFWGQAPVLSFVRKGRDMASITGEKLHVNQIIGAMASALRLSPLDIAQYRMIPDIEESRYDLLIELRDGLEGDSDAILALVDNFERELVKASMEYAQKRSSGRLAGVCPHLMKRGWSERQWCADVARGKRDSQYKWSYIQLAWDETSRGEVRRTFTDRGEIRGAR